MTIRLSICIPTKNFGSFIGQTLQSISAQRSDLVEVVIVDGGSTDNTAEQVYSFQKDFPNTTYIRNTKALGVDKDLALAVSAARGDYCWLMSADDVIKANAIGEILAEINSNHDTYLFNRSDCGFDLSHIRDRFWLEASREDEVFDFSKRERTLEYFTAARSLGAVFSYISSIVFLKENWVRHEHDHLAEGTNYQHAYILLKILLKDKRKHKYIRRSLVRCRGQNDSFLSPNDEGVVKRYLIDIAGYELIANALFDDKELSAAFLSILRRECGALHLLRIAIRVLDDPAWEQLRQKLSVLGYPSFWLTLLSGTRLFEKRFRAFYWVRRLRKQLFSIGAVSYLKTDGWQK